MATYHLEVDPASALDSLTVESVTFSHVSPYVSVRLTAGKSNDTAAFERILHVDGLARIVIDGVETVVEPESGPDPIWLQCIGKSVETASVVPPGVLRLAFRDGDSVTVGSDAHYEPWRFFRGDGLMVISPAGGSVVSKRTGPSN